MIKRNLAAVAALVFAAAGAFAVPTSNVHAAQAEVKCHLKYNLAGWSIIYKHATGNGTVRCDNGQTARVKIEVVGGGLTAGKYRIDNGTGEISHVRGISDVFGSYAQAGADAGLVKSAGAGVLTKGTTSLALAGTGEGINLGISAGKFTITRR